MLETILKKIIEALLEVLPEDKVKEAIDKAIDKLENVVEASANKFDDMLVLPILKKVREMFNIPDND